MTGSEGRETREVDSSTERRDDTIRDHLTDWPYVPQYLQQSLDHELIARHGEAILRRALNTGRLVCFVGSGISMSYGRLGWGDMVRRLLDQQREPLKAGPQNGLASRLRETLRQIVVKDLPASRYPAIFQLGEELAKACAPATGETENNFRSYARQLVFDDHGHAYVLYEDLQADLSKLAPGTTGERKHPFPLPDVTALTRASILGVDASPRVGQPSWVPYFMLSRDDLDLWYVQLEHAFATVPFKRSTQQLLAAVRASYCTGSESGENDKLVHLRPLHRFVLPALFRLTATVDDLFLPDRVDDAPGTPKADAPGQNLFEHRLRGWSTSIRSDVTPAEIDPLTLLADGLSISRYITTNYDLDLERLMRDRGFVVDSRRRAASAHTAQPARPEPNASDALGAGARDTVFQADMALQLVEFTVHNPDHALSVVHLHGRATQGDDMIVTERDYLERYLRKGDEADLVNTAISLAFGSNPLLFVGSGMSEDDILRPLRQFLAERKNRADRRVVVLLPADSTCSKQIEETIAHYSRYGVFTVHYGYAEIAGAQSTDEQDMENIVRDPTARHRSPPSRIRWLAHAKAMCGDIKACLTELIDWLGARGNTPTRGLLDALRAIEGLRLADGSADKSGWLELLNIGSGTIEMKRLDRLDGVLLRKLPQLSPQLENALLVWSLHVVMDAVRAFSLIDLTIRWKSGGDIGDHLPTNWNRPPDDERTKWLRLLMSARAVVAGLPNALIGLCLSAKLTEIKESWLVWRVRSEEQPRPRPNGGPRWLLPNDDEEDNAPWRRFLPPRMPVIARHPIALRDRQGTASDQSYGSLVPQTDRFLGHSPSHTFRVFCRSLRAARTDEASFHFRRPSRTGRRVYVMLAPRGVGKGHFFEMLSKPQRLGEFVEFSWPEGRPEQYAASASFNLSFCHEVASVFDRLANFLVERAHAVFSETRADGPGPAEQIWDANLRLKHDRVGRLTRILEIYSEGARQTAQAVPRIFIAINGFNFLFDDRGFPKNAQLHRLVMALLVPRVSDAPLDLILVCTDQSFPRLFTARGRMPELRSPFKDEWASIEPIVMEHLTVADESEQRRLEVDSLLQRLGVRLVDKAKKNPANAAPQRAGGFFLHVLRGARASTTMAKYFLEVALAIAAHPGEISDIHSNQGCSKEGWIDRLRVPSATDRDELQGSIFDAAMHDDASAKRIVRQLPGKLRRIAKQCDCKAERKPTVASLKAIIDEKSDSPSNDQKSDSRKKLKDLIDEDFASLFRELGWNRFLLTIVGAAASEASCRTDGVDGEMKVEDVTGWIRSALARGFGDSRGQRDDAIIAAVLTLYRDRHESRAPLPCRSEIEASLASKDLPLRDDLPPDRFRERSGEVAAHFIDAMKGPHGWILQQHVLWHLAVIGHPAEADVLAEAPKIQKACMQMVRHIGSVLLAEEYRPSDDELRQFGRRLTLRIVTAALDILVHRCLVFRLHPVSLEVSEARVSDGEPIEEWDDKRIEAHREARRGADEEESKAAPLAATRPSWRFALHRFVQRTIFHRLHSPYVEYPQVDQFSLSMWATQPDDLPRPNAEAAHDIAELVAAWTGYPRSVRGVDRPSAYHTALVEAFDGDPKSEPAGDAEIARAAVIRSERERTKSLPARMLRAAFGVVRSVYSVGVVSRYHESDSGTPQAPEEGYFERHRLQIRWLIQTAIELKRRARRAREQGGEAVPANADAPFFAEEIVWLYNECGLLSLVEGRLEAATGLFRRALRATRVIEPNRGHGALWSRVHLNLAIADIERGRIRVAKSNLEAIRSTKDENPILRLLAHGLIGMTEHLAGDLSRAERIYTDAIHDLQAYGQSRSVAIFSRQLGELYRMQGPASYDKAAAAIDQAIARATQGGHEDVRQLAKLSRVRLRIDRLAPEDTGLLQHDLDAIEQYGHRMGMPRLVAEAEYARSSYLLSLGETHYASALAASSLELATANDLRLRQVTALSLLAKTCDRRGMQSASAPLRARASELAEACEYTSVRLSAAGRVPRQKR